MKNQYILLNLFRFKCNELILIDNRGNKKGEHLITFSPLNLNANSTKYEFVRCFYRSTLTILQQC